MYICVYACVNVSNFRYLYSLFERLYFSEANPFRWHVVDHIKIHIDIDVADETRF